MLKRLETVIKKRGIMLVSIELGYKSTAAVAKWIKDKRIPPIANDKVCAYLKSVSK